MLKMGQGYLNTKQKDINLNKKISLFLLLCLFNSLNSISITIKNDLNVALLIDDTKQLIMPGKTMALDFSDNNLKIVEDFTTFINGRLIRKSFIIFDENEFPPGLDLNFSIEFNSDYSDIKLVGILIP